MFDSNNVDQNALKLTQAIGLKEGGGKFLYDDHSGDAGTSKGAYQWQPGNFEAAAKKYKLDPNDFSSQNQNKVAYMQVKERLDAGLKPWEVAAEWNSGNKNNWKDHSGDTVINGKTIHYDTPSYVEGVKGYYSKLTGSPTPTPTETPVKGADIYNPKTTGGKLLKLAGNITGQEGLGEDIGGAISDVTSSKQFQESIDQHNTMVQKLQDAIATQQQSGKDTSRLEKVLGEIQADVPKKEDFMSGVQNKTTAQILADVGQSALGIAGGAILPGGSAITRVLGGAALGGGMGALGAIQGGETDLNTIGKHGAIGAALGGLTGGVLEGISLGLSKLGGKTLEQVLATPADKVSSLSAPERKAYFDAQKEILNRTNKETEAAATKEVQQKTQQAVTDIKNLSSEVDKASREEAIALKPKVIAGFREQSDTYAQLIEEGLAKAPDAQVDKNELLDFIKTKFEEDPDQLALAKKQFGLSEKIPVEGEDIQMEPQTELVPLRDLYQKTKDLRQTLSGSAVKGSRTYTPQELATDKNVGALLDFMKTKGVDLSEANKFWAQWAPLRNRIVRELKPFDTEGINKMPFTSTLKKIDTADSQSFVKSIEDTIGEPVGAKTKTALGKLDKAKMDKIAVQIDAQTKKTEQALQKRVDLGTLKADQYETERIAAKKKLINQILIGAGIAAGLGVSGIGKALIKGGASLIGI